MKVTLIRQYDLVRRIPAIKAIREATPDGLGIKEAKDISDALLRGEEQTIDVAAVEPLQGHFQYEIVPSEVGIDRQVILEFFLAAMAYSTPETAERLRALPCYAAIRKSL